MVDWLPGGRETNRRLEALEREVERLRTQSSTNATRLEAVTSQLGALTGQVSGVSEEGLHDLAQMMWKLEARLGALEDIAGPRSAEAADEKAKADREEFTAMRTAIKRTERQLDLYAEEGRKTGAALWERLEGLRATRSDDPPLSARR